MPEEQIISLFHKIIKKDWICLDIGACHGTHTLELASIVEKGLVFAFEPHPDNFKSLVKNIKSYKNVKLLNFAVSNTDGIIDLFNGKNGYSTEFNILGKDLENNTTESLYKCKVISIDSYFNLNQKIDFIKIDVEGAEHLVIDGLKETILKYKPIMIIEFHHDEGWTGSKILYDLGYKILNVYSNFSECGTNEERECYHGVAMPKELNISL